MKLDYKAIGKRIRAARKKAGLTQEVLAEAAKISPSHLILIFDKNCIFYQRCCADAQRRRLTRRQVS